MTEIARQTVRAAGKRGRMGIVAAGIAAATAMLLAFVVFSYLAPGATAAQTQYAPKNTATPTIQGTARVGETVTSTTGTWSGTAPIVYTYQWRRCNRSGEACVNIPNADNQRYTIRAGDQGNTLRVVVTATNASGKSSTTSPQTAVVGAAAPAPPPPPAEPTDRIAASAVTLPTRLIVQDVQFSPGTIRSRTDPITIRVKVVDTKGRDVVGALVFARSTPLVTSAPREALTDNQGWATLQTVPRRTFSLVYRRGFSLQFFVRARKQGDNPLAGISARRLVQVRIAPGS